MAMYNMQLTDDEERKRKEAEFKSNLNSNILPGVNNPVIDINKRLPTLSNQNSVMQTSSVGEPKKLSLYEPPTNISTKIPGPEAFTNVPAKDRTVSNVGIQYTPQDLQLKDNISKMDAIIKAGVDSSTGKPVTLEQIEQVNKIKQQAGFLRGGTDRRPVDVNGLPMATAGNTLSNMTDSGLSIQFDPSVPESNKKTVMQSYGVNDSNAQTLRNLQGDQFTDREFVKNYRPPSNNGGILPGMNESERIAIRNDNVARDNARLAANTSLTNNRINALNTSEGNRLEGINITGQNKLRDIQGQVAQAPPVKQLDDAYGTIDTYDDLGQKTGQKIYNKRTGEMANQAATFTTPKPATTEKLLKMRASKDPNFTAAEAEYKSRFGNLPY